MLFSLLLASAVAAPSDPRESLELPVVSAILRVRQEANGQCAEVEAGPRGRPALIRMTDICHGWSTQSCATILLIKVQGVIQDAAQALFLRESRSADLVAAIDAEIGRKWPHNELLHLSLTSVDCGGPGMTIAFEGSRVPKVDSASAVGVAGTLILRSPDRVEIVIHPAR